jgi:hypothetical protein
VEFGAKNFGWAKAEKPSFGKVTLSACKGIQLTLLHSRTDARQIRPLSSGSAPPPIREIEYSRDPWYHIETELSNIRDCRCSAQNLHAHRRRELSCYEVSTLSVNRKPDFMICGQVAPMFHYGRCPTTPKRTQPTRRLSTIHPLRSSHLRIAAAHR